MTDQLAQTASHVGLTASVTQRGAMFGVTVERHADDWSMEPTQIAIARSEEEARRRAVETLKAIGPQIAKKVAAAMPDRDDLTLAGGVGSDGAITTLRVERDGSVRLHPDDIEAIATEVFRRFSAAGVLR